MRFLPFVFKNVLRRKTRSALTTFGVAVAIAAIVALLSITGGYERSSKELYANRGVDMVVIRANVAQRATSTLDESVVNRVKELEGIEKVAPALSDKVSFDEGLASVPLNGWPADSFAFAALQVVQGRALKADDKRKVMLGRSLADELKKKVGDSLQIEGEDFEVVGVYESGNMVENRAATVPLHDLQELMDRIGQVTELQIALSKNVPDLQAAMSKLRTEIESLQNEEGASLGLMALPTEQYVTSDNQMRLAHAMAWVTSGIALIVGSIGVLNTMIVSVLERTQEIGILRAIGWRKSRIVRMILAESFSLSIIGAILGTAIAAILILVLTQFAGAAGLVRGEITPKVVAIGFIMAVLVALVGGTYPALRGAALPPTEALRYE